MDRYRIQYINVGKGEQRARCYLRHSGFCAAAVAVQLQYIHMYGALNTSKCVCIPER